MHIVVLKRFPSVLLLVLAVVGGYALLEGLFAQEGPDWNKGLPRQHKSKWLVSDSRRPLAPVVTPGRTSADAPSDAVVLFDGKDLSRWRGSEGGPARWKVEGGYAEFNNTGSISTKEKFGDCQLHLEWMCPTPPKGISQDRGNSGIYFMERYELQVLDSYDNKTYADGACAAIYAQHPPLFNACRKPGEWQTYDVVFRAPRFKDGKLAEPARMTVFHNGVLVHHNAEVFGTTVYRGLAKYEPHEPTAPIHIQDHGDRQKMRFRNIWVRKLDLTEEAAE